MTVVGLCDDLMLLSVFMLIGFFILEIFKPLKKIYLPASLIGGIVLLILGPQAANIVSIPDSFSQVPSVLINMVLASLVFGVSINKDRINSIMDYSCVTMTAYGMQMFLGVGLGAVFEKIWTGLPKGWGIMGVFAFHGGHGTAAAAASAFEKLGVEGNMSVGMVLSTFGLVIAMSVGMVIVNFGIRRGWATYISNPKDKHKDTKDKKEEKKVESLTKDKVKNKFDNLSINHLALQFGWILSSVFVGNLVFDFIGKYSSFVANLPGVLRGIFGAFILWKTICILKLEYLVDLKTIRMIGGFLLEIVILSAMATLNLTFMSEYIVPVLIYTIIITIFTVIIVFGLAHLFIKEEWFEKACMAFGAAMGNTSTGLALVRAVDPDSNSDAGDVHGVYSAIMSWKDVFVGITPVWLMSGVALTMGIGLAIMLGFAAIGIIFFKKK